MSISPWIVGQTHPGWSIPFTSPSGPVDLTGATVTMWIFTREGASVQGGGSCTISGDPKQGNVFYQPIAADSPVAGNFWVAIKAVFPDSTVLWQNKATPWKITKLP